jgi:hypothetical protein
VYTCIQYTYSHREGGRGGTVEPERRLEGQQFTKLGWKYTDKIENQFFLIYKEIQMGSVAKSYMTKGLLIYE